jgi:hypothetical protein
VNAVNAGGSGVGLGIGVQVSAGATAEALDAVAGVISVSARTGIRAGRSFGMVRFSFVLEMSSDAAPFGFSERARDSEARLFKKTKPSGLEEPTRTVQSAGERYFGKAAGGAISRRDGARGTGSRSVDSGLS